MVVVTLQYRLGALGFLTAPGQVPANLGLRDQVLALRWVRRNVAAFGGDPRAVTVFGESAGGSSVAALILSPLASNLFQRAIVQSAAQGGFFSSESVEQGLEKTMRLAARLGCCHKQQQPPKFELGNVKQWLPEVVRCLKERPVEAILAASADAFATNGLFLPVYGADAEVLPVRPEEVLKEESDGGDGNHQGAHHHQQLPNPGDLDLMVRTGLILLIFYLKNCILILTFALLSSFSLASPRTRARCLRWRSFLNWLFRTIKIC